MYRIAILDDEKLHRENIRKSVTAIMDGKLHSITEFTCPDEVVRYTERHGFPFDIIIMDICFEGSRQNGIELAHSIQQFSDKCQIIFCTSFI
ncbi:MAG: LytR/AlgR family response regulator transcription factor, partial [Huintestinicola sp.]